MDEKMKGSEDFGGVFMIWSSKMCLVGSRMAHDVVNPKTLELQTAKEILEVIFDARVSDIDEMIRLRCEDRDVG